jgi:alcohol dehydrogenase
VFVGAVLPIDSISINPEQVVRRWLSIHGVHNYAPQDLLKAVDFLAAAGERFPLADLVSESFSLTDVNQAIEYAGRQKPIRIAVRP